MAGLLDYLQAASNAVAGNVSGPVDLINSGLLAAGLPMPRNPVGGSQWMAERGLTREVKDPYARVIGETAGLLAPTVIAAKAPQIAEGLLSHADAYRRYHAATTAPGAPATVWHASPHKFDKFDASKARTGEGANVYGAGTYLAESPQVSGKGGAYYEQFKSHPAARQSGGPFAYKVELPDDAIARMVDWDKPWTQQPREVREALTAIARSDDAIMREFQKLGPNAPGGHFQAVLSDRAVRLKKYEGMRAGLPEAQATPDIQYGYDAASEALRKAGIPGIRYLDDGSRGAGRGTSNFVVFPGNEGLLKILSRE